MFAAVGASVVVAVGVGTDGGIAAGRGGSDSDAAAALRRDEAAFLLDSW